MKRRVIALLLSGALVLGLCPAVTIPTMAAEDEGKLNFSTGTTAYCTACGKDATWTAIGGSIKAAYWFANGGHYYLTNHITSGASDGAVTVNTTAGNAACLHLNGFDITSTAGTTVTYYGTTPGTLNIMGKGTVSGSGMAASGYKAATLNVTNGAKLNLYGGTYTKGATDAPVIWGWNGEIHMYDGVKVQGHSNNTGTYSGCVMMQNPEVTFYMHGGEITGGTTGNSGGNVCVNAGSFTMSGGTISDGNAAGYHGGNVYVKNGSFAMTGGTITDGTAKYYGSNVHINDGATAAISGGIITNGITYVATSGTTTLSGIPQISELKLPSGVTVTLDGLTAGADVAVNAAAGAFTNAGVSANLSNFRSANGIDSIVAKADGTLAYLSNAKLSLDADGYGICPVCATSVKWTALSGELTATKWLQKDGHLYLSGNVTYTGSDYALGFAQSGTIKTCLHLNGYNVTSSTGKAASFGGGVVNIMGNGTVSGAGTAYGGATIHTWGNGTMNLYGGTYTKGASTYPVLFIGAYSVNMYNGVNVDGGGTTPSSYPLIYGESASALLKMYGGTVQNGKSSSYCGGVRFYTGNFYMYGGTIQNCEGTAGGSVYVYNTGKVYLSGGTITGGSVYSIVSDNLTLSGAPKIDDLKLAADVTAKVETLTAGTKIKISNTCGVTADAAALQSYVEKGYFATDLEGKQVAVENGKLVIADIPQEEPETPVQDLPAYITGDVLYETDFEDETAGALPAGWSAGYSEGDAANGTKTSFGWGSSGTMTAKVVEFGSYGKVFQFNSGNNDAFAAMGEISTTNYLYEATVYVDRGYGSFGLANNYYGPTTTATGALYSSIYPKGDSAKYTYKGAGLSGSALWETSYSPASGDIIDLQILSLNGQNYILYNGEKVAQCAARLSGQTVDHPGFYTCYGGIYVLGVKVTEVFAADMTAAGGKITTDPVKLVAEFDFDKTQGIYERITDLATVELGVLVQKGDEPAQLLTRETEGVREEVLTLAQETDANMRFAYGETLEAADYETWYTFRPYAVIDGICFYGETVAYQPASLANGAYKTGDAEEKEAIAAAFGSCSAFTADETDSVTFTLFSDFHYKKGMYPATIADLKTILQRADDANVEFVLSAGDFTNDMAGSPELYNTFRGYTTKEGKVLPAYNVYGNHELEFGNSMETVTWTLTNDEFTDHTVVWGTADGAFQSTIGYYYFEAKGFRIIGLDSEHSYNPTTGQYEHNKSGSSGAPSGNTKAGSLGPDQLSWLETVLMDAAEKKIPCIVMAHDGFGPDWCDTSPDAEAVRALYRKANDQTPGTVLMSINGHIHTDHQGWMDGVFYLDTNTVRNNWWQETAVDHYGDAHTFLYEEYDDEGNLVATYEKKYSDLTMGAKTWFSEDPISCNVTLSKDGTVIIDGVKSDWAYGIVPTAAATVDGVECEITSGTYWDCDRQGHVLRWVTEGEESRYACINSQCGYVAEVIEHSGIVLELTDGTVTYPESTEAAVQAHLAQPGSVIRLSTDGVTLEIPAGETVTVDFNGKTANITGSGTLQGIDSANDAFQVSAGGAVAANTVTVLQDVTGGKYGYRYIALTADGKTSFHRLEMRLKDVTLRTEGAGVYYKALYNCDSVLGEQVTSYGVALSLYNMPGADFMTEQQECNYNRYTQITTPLEKGVIATSGSVLNIMKETNGALRNYSNGLRKIYANPYVTLKNGVTLVTDNENPGKTASDPTFDGIAHSLFDVVKAIDGRFSQYDEEKQGIIVNFYNQWKDKGLQLQLENIQ